MSHLIAYQQVACARDSQAWRMQPEGLIADYEAVVGGLAIAGLHKHVDGVNHVLPTALT